MKASLTGARRLQAAFVVLLVVCVAQLGWWLIDQWMYSAEVTHRTEAFYRESLAAAETLYGRGLAPGAVVQLFPAIVATPDGFAIDPVLIAELGDERFSRINQYAWEGGFFLLVLLSTIGVLASAVRSETRLRRRQHNFVTAVTHELKSPLAAMRLAAETLEMRDADAEARERLTRRLLTSLDRMESTVSNVLDTARIDEGKMPLAPENVDVVRTVSELIEALSDTAQTRNVTLRAEMPEQLCLPADAQALNAILRNLLDNALAAVTGVEGGAVVVVIETTPGEAAIEVRDNGRGFDPADAEKLFEKFWRPGDEMRREGRGTGLGLYIARYLASSSGATLTAHSDGRDKGATLRLVWPAGKPERRP
jgi:signal transduction histidine kinase